MVQAEAPLQANTWKRSQSAHAADFILLARELTMTIGLAILYFVIGYVALWAQDSQAVGALVWPPAGFALALVVLGGTRYIPAIALGSLMLNLWSGTHPLASVGIALGSALQYAVAASILNTVGFKRTFDSLSDIFALFIFGAVLTPMISATILSMSFFLSGVIPAAALATTWLTWWAAIATGILVFAPPILTWVKRDDLFPGRERRLWTYSELGLLLFAFAAINTFVFYDFVYADIQRGPLASLVFLPLVWAAVRFGRRAVTLAVALTSFIAVLALSHGLGPFSIDGESFTVQAYVLQLFISITAVTTLILSVIVSQRVRAEDQVSGLNATLMEAQSIAMTGSWVYDLESKKITWSDEFYRINGMEPRDAALTKKSFADHVMVEDRPHVIAAMDAILEKLEPMDIEYRVVRPDGSVRYLHAFGKPVIGRWGVVDKVIGVAIDITERQKAEIGLAENTRALEEALALLKQSDTAKSDFLAVLAHELRNPLAPLVSTIELIRMGEASEQDVAVLDRQVQTMKVLLDDLLDLSRITRKKIVLDRKDVDMGKVVLHAVETARPFIESRHHTLTLSLPDEPFVVSADAVRMEQVLVNLLNNAGKYTNPGGKIAVSLWEDAGDAVVSVKDNGIGISPQFLKAIFEPFSQIERGQGQQGLGVGLHLVRELVALHGGTILVKSEGKGKGSEFMVRLSRVKTPEDMRPVVKTLASFPIRESGVPSIAAQGGALRVLVVDDNESAATTLTRVLIKKGYDARYVFSGGEALAMAAEFRPDVFFLDIGMPEMDGYVLARALQATGMHGRSTLCALTGYGQEGDRERTAAAGFHCHLVKPVSIDTIEEVLSSHQLKEQRR